MAYSEPKGRPGKIACQETGDRAQASGAVRREVRVIWRKSHYLNPSLVRHEALFDRTGVEDPRLLAVAAAGMKLEEA